MTTASDLITSAFRRARIIGRDETPGADESADALAELNRFLDELWLDKLAVFDVQSEQFAFVGGQQSYTMGTGGNFNTTRPVRVVPGSRFIVANNVERSLTVLTERKAWDDIPYKQVQAPPQVVWVEESYPLATLYFYPIPDQAYTVFITSWKRLQTLSGLTTALSLPPGYESLLLNGMATRLAPEYGLEAPASVVRAYGNAKKALAMVNYELPVMSMPAAVLTRPTTRPNIISGDTV